MGEVGVHARGGGLKGLGEGGIKVFGGECLNLVDINFPRGSGISSLQYIYIIWLQRLLVYGEPVTPQIILGSVCVCVSFMCVYLSIFMDPPTGSGGIPYQSWSSFLGLFGKGTCLRTGNLAMHGESDCLLVGPEVYTWCVFVGPYGKESEVILGVGPGVVAVQVPRRLDWGRCC